MIWWLIFSRVFDVNFVILNCSLFQKQLVVTRIHIDRLGLARTVQRSAVTVETIMWHCTTPLWQLNWVVIQTSASSWIFTYILLVRNIAKMAIRNISTQFPLFSRFFGSSSCVDRCTTMNPLKCSKSKKTTTTDNTRCSVRIPKTRALVDATNYIS